MTQSGQFEIERIEGAVAWRCTAEGRMAEARELLEGLRDAMPISGERVQLEIARSRR
jgi:hypothetical protein